MILIFYILPTIVSLVSVIMIIAIQRYRGYCDWTFHDALPFSLIGFVPLLNFAVAWFVLTELKQNLGRQHATGQNKIENL